MVPVCTVMSSPEACLTVMRPLRDVALIAVTSPLTLTLNTQGFSAWLR